MKKILFILLSVLSTTTSNAQKLENTTLWKISGNGLESPSYLFGTIHITCDASLDKDVENALENTTQLVLEIDMDDPKMQSKMMSGLYMKDGKTLKDYVTDEEYTAIDSLFIKNIGISVKTMQNMKPFLLTAMLYPKMIDCQMQSFELTLMSVAKKQNEEIKGLETIEEQIQIFDIIPYKEQVADLKRMAKDNLAYDKETFAKLLNIYKKEDITAMLEMMNDENYQSLSNYQDILLMKRNKNWIPKIKEYSKNQPTFFGVGAGHLAGENGVINLLKKEGYVLTPIK